MTPDPRTEEIRARVETQTYTRGDVKYLLGRIEALEGSNADQRGEIENWEDWSNDLAMRVPDHLEDDIAQEAIIENWIDALVAVVDAARALTGEPGEPQWKRLSAALAALDGGEGE